MGNEGVNVKKHTSTIKVARKTELNDLFPNIDHFCANFYFKNLKVPFVVLSTKTPGVTRV